MNRATPILIKRAALATLAVAAFGCGGSEAGGDAPQTAAAAPTAEAAVQAVDQPDTLRVALFNIRELSLDKLREGADAGVGSNAQLVAAAEIIRQVRPHVLILNEIDHDISDQDRSASAREFARLYLEPGDHGVVLPHAFAAPNNTGTISGLDLNGDGTIAGPDDVGTREYGDDSFGFGTYEGQYSMAVLSAFPIDENAVRTFQRFRWKDLPGHHMPAGFYTDAAEESLRLSSKSHWDVPVQLPTGQVRLLLSHPTPPVFDGEEDRNGRRNFDEIGFWAAYLNDSPWLYDDAGIAGGYGSDEAFIVAGDLNARPDATDGVYDGQAAVDQLLTHPRVQDTGAMLTARGALAGRAAGPPGFLERSTAVFSGGWRLDYLLPSTGVTVLDGGVYWPAVDDDADGAALAEAASDHRLIWLDLIVR